LGGGGYKKIHRNIGPGQQSRKGFPDAEKPGKGKQGRKTSLVPVKTKEASAFKTTTNGEKGTATDEDKNRQQKPLKRSEEETNKKAVVKDETKKTQGENTPNRVHRD